MPHQVQTATQRHRLNRLFYIAF